MKHTKANVIRVLHRLVDNCYTVGECFKAYGEPEKAERYLDEALHINNCILVLTDKKHFQELADIFGLTEDE